MSNTSYDTHIHISYTYIYNIYINIIPMICTRCMICMHTSDTYIYKWYILHYIYVDEGRIL